ncbi:MAG: hypothetical protein MI866_19335, partial [Bacteroidales bacterium]|nr:hypothetical protein [Bacteroidales bacterium]
MKKLLFSVALSALTIVAFGQDAEPVKADKVTKTVHERPAVTGTAGVLNWEATTQTGVNNTSTITQNDGVMGTNIALVDQNGTGLTNTSTIKQDGYDQDAYVMQDGEGNWA